MYLNHLRLINFRSYPEISLEFKNLLTVLYGENGAGKTNLLEAISLLTPGRGLRGAKLEESAHNQCGEWAINAEVSGYKIATGLEPGLSKRVVKIDGEKQRGTYLLANYANAIWLTPQMDGIFLESPRGRRLFFDRLIYNFDPEHASRVAIYENAMRERLKLLKTGSTDKTWLKVLERRMAEYGVAIAAARNEVIRYLQESLNHSVTSFPRPEIRISGRFEACLCQDTALEVEDTFAEELAAARYDDSANGRTGIGVHKTDFKVINIAQNTPAEFCSTGEQKALLLSIILGLARLLKEKKNKTPLVLLDEVIAHLDKKRRGELFSEIANLNCQSFLTGTEKTLFSGITGDVAYLKITPGSALKN